MAVYRETARRRQAMKQQVLAERRQRAWDLARQAAALLKEELGATQVRLFGSLVHGALFHARSDVDLAVWGLDEKIYYQAVSRLLDLDPAIEVDLIRVEDATLSLQNLIEREGVSL